MTLKTLKDLKQTEWNIEVTPEEYFVNYDETRQEAIKNTEIEMKKLQTVLITGSLPFKLKLVKTESISPLLGEGFIKKIF